MTASPFEVGCEIEVTPFLYETPLAVEILSAESFDQGGSAKIFKGLAKVPYRPYKVALKVIAHVLSKDQSELVRRELQIVAKLATRSMRRILPFIGTASVGFHSVIVMEYMRHGNMVQYFRANPRADRQRLLIQVAEAVYWLHDFVNLVHGDLKCENVLINNDQDAVLADFGLSTLIEQGAASVTTCTDIRNMNTVRFAAPELLGLGEPPSTTMRKRSKTPQGDVYAFGMLVLQAFTGKHPWPHLEFPQAVLVALITRVVHPRPSEDATRAGLTDNWWAVCLACWEYAPSQRPTMHQVWDTLRGRWPGNTAEEHHLPEDFFTKIQRIIPLNGVHTGIAPPQSVAGSADPASMKSKVLPGLVVQPLPNQPQSDPLALILRLTGNDGNWQYTDGVSKFPARAALRTRQLGSLPLPNAIHPGRFALPEVPGKMGERTSHREAPIAPVGTLSGAAESSVLSSASSDDTAGGAPLDQQHAFQYPPPPPPMPPMPLLDHVYSTAEMHQMMQQPRQPRQPQQPQQAQQQQQQQSPRLGQKRPRRLEDTPGIEPTKREPRKLQQACNHCKKVKMKCNFTPPNTFCDRCIKKDYSECRVQGRVKKPGARGRPEI